MYFGSLTAAHVTHQLRLVAANSPLPERYLTLFEALSTPFLQSISDVGYFHPSNFIQTIQRHMVEIESVHSSHSSTPHFKKIQNKYAQLFQFISDTTTSPPHFELIAFDVLLLIPSIVWRYSNTPQLFSTIQKMILTLNEEIDGSKRNQITASTLLVARLLDRSVVMKCQPTDSISYYSHITSCPTIEYQLLRCSASDDFMKLLLLVDNILSFDPSCSQHPIEIQEIKYQIFAYLLSHSPQLEDILSDSFQPPLSGVRQ